MEYSDLLLGLNYTGVPPKGRASGAAQNSRLVTPGTVFVCIKGQGHDGHKYAQDALEKGAGMLVTQRHLGLKNEVTVKDTRKAYAQICQNFFGRPAEKLCLVGITGTNGKTTTSSVLKQTLEAMGINCGLIGTAGSEIGTAHIPAKFTTPEAWDLAALLARMVKAGCSHVVMEASSQALHQGRLFGLNFQLGIFTNLTKDHLDYHGDMQNYYEAKKQLFAQCKTMLVNLDDPFGQKLCEESKKENCKTFSIKDNAANFIAKNIELSQNGVKFAFLGEDFLHPVKFAMPGQYSVQNALAAGAAAVLLGQDPQKTSAALATVPGVKGRCQVLYSKDYTILRDFAHTADGLEKLLSAIKPFTKGRLLVVFGCAGDREPTKRAEMGQAVAKYADIVFVTADNPRTENVQETMRDAAAAVKKSKKPCHTQENRQTAVQMALDMLQKDDVLALCGKGHEDYQVLCGWTQYLNEEEIVSAWLQSKAQM